MYQVKPFEFTSALVKWTADGKYKDLEEAIQRHFISTKYFEIGNKVEVR